MADYGEHAECGKNGQPYCASWCPRRPEEDKEKPLPATVLINGRWVEVTHSGDCNY